MSVTYCLCRKHTQYYACRHPHFEAHEQCAYAPTCTGVSIETSTLPNACPKCSKTYSKDGKCQPSSQTQSASEHDEQVGEKRWHGAAEEDEEIRLKNIAYKHKWLERKRQDPEWVEKHKERVRGYNKRYHERKSKNKPPRQLQQGPVAEARRARARRVYAAKKLRDSNSLKKRRQAELSNHQRGEEAAATEDYEGPSRATGGSSQKEDDSYSNLSTLSTLSTLSDLPIPETEEVQELEEDDLASEDSEEEAPIQCGKKKQRRAGYYLATVGTKRRYPESQTREAEKSLEESENEAHLSGRGEKYALKDRDPKWRDKDCERTSVLYQKYKDTAAAEDDKEPSQERVEPLEEKKTFSGRGDEEFSEDEIEFILGDQDVNKT